LIDGTISGSAYDHRFEGPLSNISRAEDL